MDYYLVKSTTIKRTLIPVIYLFVVLVLNLSFIVNIRHCVLQKSSAVIFLPL